MIAQTRETRAITASQNAYDKMRDPQYEIRTHESNYGDAYYYYYDNLYSVTRY